MNWFRENIMFLSLGKYGWYLYIHFIPKYTITFAIAVRRKNPFEAEERDVLV